MSDSKNEPKSPNWRKDLRQRIDALLTQELKEVTYSKEGGIEVWSIEIANYRYSFALQYGKVAVIPELKMAFYKTGKGNNFGVTSPNATEQSFHPTWDSMKKIAGLSKNTNRIMEKNRRLHWLFSPTKEWLYVDNQAQYDFLINKIVPQAVSQFKKFIRK